MAPRRQPYEHLNQPLASASPDAASVTPSEDGGLDIVIEDDGFNPVSDDDQLQQAQPPAPEPVQAQPEPQDKPLSADDEAHNLLKAQLERSKQNERRLEQRLGEESQGRTVAEERASQAVADRYAAEENAIANALQAAEQKVSEAKRKYAYHLSNAENDEAVDAAEALAEAKYDVQRLKEGQAALTEQRQRKPDAAPRQEPPAQPRQSKSEHEAIEEWIGGLTPTKQGLVRQHYDQFFKNGQGERQTTRLIKAHEMALLDGVIEDSPEYVKAVRQYMGLERAQPQQQATPVDVFNQQTVSKADGGQVQQPAPQPQQQAPRQQQRSAPPPAAPPSRDGVANGGRQVLRLTAAEVAFCRDSGTDPKEYAIEKNKIARGDYTGISFMEGR